MIRCVSSGVASHAISERFSAVVAGEVWLGTVPCSTTRMYCARVIAR